MVPQSEALKTSGITSLFVGVSHFAAHSFYGSSSAFAEAGVMEAGIVVVAVTFLLSYGGMRDWFL